MGAPNDSDKAPGGMPEENPPEATANKVCQSVFDDSPIVLSSAWVPEVFPEEEPEEGIQRVAHAQSSEHMSRT